MVIPLPFKYAAYFERTNTSIHIVPSLVGSTAQAARMETWRDRFRRRFQELQDQDGLTQEALGERMGVTQGTIGHWLNGRRTPKTLETFEALAKALGVHPAWLLYGFDPSDVEVTQAAQRLKDMNNDRRDALITLILDR